MAQILSANMDSISSQSSGDLSILKGFGSLPIRARELKVKSEPPNAEGTDFIGTVPFWGSSRRSSCKFFSDLFEGRFFCWSQAAVLKLADILVKLLAPEGVGSERSVPLKDEQIFWLCLSFDCKYQPLDSIGTFLSDVARRLQRNEMNLT